MIDWLVYWLLGVGAGLAVPGTECWQHPIPKAKIVYLHGLMNTKSGFGIDIENTNRKTLQEVAVSCQVSIALPVSDYKAGDIVRWYGRNAKNSEEKAKMAQQEMDWALQSCLATDETLPTIALGFSDGGYLVNHLQISKIWAPVLSAYFASGTNPLGNQEVTEIPQQVGNHLLDQAQVISALSSAGFCD